TAACQGTHGMLARMKVEPVLYGDRKVYSVAAFNQGIAVWLARLPTLWVEGEIAELRRQERWASVFFTLRDPGGGASVSVQMPRGQFDGLRLDLRDGERVHVYGRPELYEPRGELPLGARSIGRFGAGGLLGAIERTKERPAAADLVATADKAP